MHNIPIIDTHCHIWDIKSGRYNWLQGRHILLGDMAAINHDYLPTDYLADAETYNLQKFIHIEASSTKDYARQEVEWLVELAKEQPKLGGIVGGIDFNEKNDTESLLEFYHGTPLVKGVRQILNWHKNSAYSATESNYLDSPQWEKQYSLLEKYGLRFEMHICPGQMQQVADLAKKYPNIRIIINHAGFPLPEEIAYWKKALRHLAQQPNITIKLSGFGMFYHQWNAQTIEGVVTHVIECFGIDRCMFASNFPVDKLYNSLSNLITYYYEIVQSYSMHEKEKLFSRNAEKIYLYPP